MIRLLIADDIASTRENLQKLLSFEDDIEVCGTAADGRQAVDAAHQLKPDVILMDVNMPHMDGIRATEEIAQQLPNSPVIIMSVQGERDYLRRAMQAGAREFLIKPFSHDELATAIRRVHELEKRQETVLAHTAPAAPAPPVATPSRPPGDVFLVFSGKGGVGRTVLATNLAVTLARDTGARVALVDLDLQFGDVGVMLNLDHSRSITDLIDSAEQLAPETLEEVLAEGPAGVKVLLAPISPELADLVTPGHVRAIMAELRRSFDYVVVDTSTHLAEFNLEVIEMASKVLVVTSLTIAAIKDAKLTLKVLESLNVDPESILLVINRVDAFLEFNRESIERNLNCPVAAEIAHDPRLVGDSVTHGFPFVERQPEAEVSEAVRQLAVRLVPSKALAGVGAGGDQGKKRQRRGIFGR